MVSITGIYMIGWYDEMAGVASFAVSISNLTVHHQQSRSHSGEDVEQNLITLCAECHSTAQASASKNMDFREWIQRGGHRSKSQGPLWKLEGVGRILQHLRCSN